MEEFWKAVEGYEGYEVSNLGRLRSFRQSKLGKILKLHKSFDGYMRTPPLAPKRITTTIHRLVAIAFIPRVEGKLEVDHIDRNPANNCVENLRWANKSEQQINTTDRDNRSGHRNIKLIYEVSIGRNGSKRFTKKCATLEEAIRVRDEFLSNPSV